MMAAILVYVAAFSEALEMVLVTITMTVGWI